MAIGWKQAQEREKDFWNRIYLKKEQDIASYLPITDESALKFLEKTLKKFNLSSADLQESAIADVGCGPYGLIRGIDVISQTQPVCPKKIYGIDPLMETYKKFNTLPCREDLELIASKGESIPLPEGSCDFVFSINVVDHVEDPKLFLKECRRICKKNGRIFISVHVIRAPFILLGPILFLIDKNHPHHFSETNIVNTARKIFSNVTITGKVAMIEDQPDFTFANIFHAKSKTRALKRWVSTFLLSSVFIECKN